MPGGRHDRQGGAEDVEVAVEVHGEHAAPVLLGAPWRSSSGRVMPATLTTASSRPSSSTRSSNSSRTASPSVTETDDARADPPAATMRPAVVSSGVGQLLGAVERHERVHRDDERALAAELLGDGGADPAAAAGDDDDPLPASAVTTSRRGRRAPGPRSRRSSSHCSQQLAVGEVVAEAAAVVAVAGVQRPPGCPPG